jgi:hypothetical protein
MEGQIEFTVADEHVVCLPGQTIYVPPRTTHAVRAVGEQPGVMYLSVSPHVEPTHTQYGPDGQQLPPQYGVWRTAGGGEPASALSTATLLERYRAAARALAELAQANTDEATKVPSKALEGGEPKQAIDSLWYSLRPVLLQVEALERDWNELALRGSDA